MKIMGRKIDFAGNFVLSKIEIVHSFSNMNQKKKYNDSSDPGKLQICFCFYLLIYYYLLINLIKVIRQ